MMSLLSKLFYKKEPESDTIYTGRINLPEQYPDIPRFAENQNGSGEADFELVEDMVQQMLEDPDQFITLSVEKPVHDNVRFVQACRIPEGINVQLGIGEDTHTVIVERLCTDEECIRIFRDFYDTLKVEDMEYYTPMQRM